VTGFFVAATLVTLWQAIRVRDRRLFALLALFVSLTIAHTRGDWFAARPFHYVAGGAGLVLLYFLSPPRQPRADRA
jgi:hypothetical protein